MPQDYAASIQGVAIRVTRLDEQGNLLSGPLDSYTTSAFIRTSFTPNMEEGDEITEKAADGTICVSYKSPATLKDISLEVAICEPDPELTNLMSGGLLLSGYLGKTPADPSNPVAGEDTRQVALGWASAQVGEDPSGNGVAVEVWSRAIQNGKPANNKPFFHWIFPFVKTRLTGDRVIENGLLATTFEGTGLGNINFRSGPDGRWQWPAATDRPYLYARADTAPSGLKGFFRWDAVSGDQSVGSADLSAVGGVGTNVPKSGNPYPYNDNIQSAPAGFDPVLSTLDYADDQTTIGTTTAVFPASAASEPVKNVAPTEPDATGGKDKYAQNTVVYLSREDDDSKAAPPPADGGGA
jgi:hypothetical protein